MGWKKESWTYLSRPTKLPFPQSNWTFCESYNICSVLGFSYFLSIYSSHLPVSIYLATTSSMSQPSESREAQSTGLGEKPDGAQDQVGYFSCGFPMWLLWLISWPGSTTPAGSPLHRLPLLHGPLPLAPSRLKVTMFLPTDHYLELFSRSAHPFVNCSFSNHCSCPPLWVCCLLFSVKAPTNYYQMSLFSFLTMQNCCWKEDLQPGTSFPTTLSQGGSHNQLGPMEAHCPKKCCVVHLHILAHYESHHGGFCCKVALSQTGRKAGFQSHD